MSKLHLTSVLSIVVSLAACQTTVPVRIYQDQLVRPQPPAPLQLTMLAKAKDTRSQGVDQVGRHTISALMIPGPTVTTETEHLDEAIVNRVREALTASGFSVSTVDRLEQAHDPILVIQINDLRNYLFSWLYPVGLVWGNMDLTLQLVTPEGTELWHAQTAGHSGVGASIFYMSGFETRVASDLTSNVNQILEIVSSREFEDQLQQARRRL